MITEKRGRNRDDRQRPCVQFLILGGGPTGLGAATRLRDRGETDWLLLEATGRFGGLAQSWVDEQGFTWDLGGHVQFSHYDTFDRYMDGALGTDGWYVHERESWIRMLGTWIPYPFQNNLHRLPPGPRGECVKGLMEAWREHSESASRRLNGALKSVTDRRSSPGNFREWILATFGRGVAEHFMLPYNYKVWAYPPETLDFNWIADRISVPAPEKVLQSVATEKDEVSWGPNATFRFPKRGGTGAIWAAIGGALPGARVHLTVAATRIDAVSRVVHGSNGRAYRYEHLISTIPLNHLIRLTAGAVVDVGEADNLVSSSTHVVGVGIRGATPDALKTKCWMYFPESNSPYYRVTVFTNYSPENAPRPGEQWSLMAETSESGMKALEVSKDRRPCGIADAAELPDEAFIREWTIRALIEDGLLRDRKDVLSVAYRRLSQGYPTPWKGRDAKIDPILRSFEEQDIYSRGRFGAWKYEVSNQDHSFAQGYECVDRLLNGNGENREPTLRDPGAVNSRRNL